MMKSKSGSLHFTLVVATRNRPRLLKRMLVSAAGQKHAHVDVLVVDQSDDATAVKNAELVKRISETLAVRYVRSGTKGLSKARNEGLELIRGADVVAFPDDDCWYHPNVLREVAEKFRSDPAVDIILGQFAEPQPGIHPRYPQQSFKLTAQRAVMSRQVV